MSFRTLALAIVACTTTLVAAAPAGAESNRLASSGPAYLTYDAVLRVWAIGNASVELQLGFDQENQFIVQSLGSPEAPAWRLAPGTDGLLRLGGRSVTIGRVSDGFGYNGFRVPGCQPAVCLEITFDHAAAGLGVSRNYKIYPAGAAVETWTDVRALGRWRGGFVGLDGFWQLQVPDTRRLHWMSGLQSDTGLESFTLAEERIARMTTFELSSRGRSSDRTVSWFGAESEGALFFGGVMWSGAWRLAFERARGSLVVRAGLEETSVRVPEGGAVSLPHVFFGVAASLVSVSKSVATLQRSGRARAALPPPVLFNTWFAYGSVFDEADLQEEADRAAAVGVEIFVVDAGWWAGPRSPEDFTSGLGRWEADPAKFPNGLRSFADAVRTRGMRFGLWVEPERVAADVIGAAVDPSWLANDELLGIPTTSIAESEQICLANDAAWNWTWTWLTGVIDQVGVDYLKWDSNQWIDCRRVDHGHGAAEGAFKHVEGLYRLFRRLRERYPDLLIENCAQGGNRLDLALGRLTDLGWVDDRSAPSIRVRHHAQALGLAFDPAYLLTFALPWGDERFSAGADIPLFMRSRMGGALGLGFRLTELDDETLALLRREIGIYKEIRDILREASLVPLTPQPAAEPELSPPWDAVEYVSAATGEAIVFGFRNSPSAGSLLITPRLLVPDASYEVTDIDAGTLGVATGAELMAAGLELPADGGSAARLLVLRLAEGALRP